MCIILGMGVIVLKGWGNVQELNIVILNNYFDIDMQRKLFGNELVDCYMVNEYDMYDILVLFKIFSSKSEARKNWERTGKEIPPGYNEFKNIGKQKKALYIWNPVGDEK
jgi:hypothetical protein